ncbi:hypothetical protein HYV31_02855 [candidate division WWE3 bacterium]|nr:hypothetical protein [candidate division WWE3 bacterium]
MKEKLIKLKNFIKTNYKPIGITVLVSTFVLLGFIYNSPYKTSKVEILNYYPSYNAKDFPQNGAVDIVFKNPISEDMKPSLYIRFLPGVPYKKDWVSPTQLRLVPQILLTGGTEYSVEISYAQNTIGNLKFTVSKPMSNIPPLQEVTLEDLSWMHEQADAVNTSLEALKDKHPWYFNLPIITKKYAIIYNNKKNQFRISIYSKGMTEKEKSDTLKSATERLNQVVGVDAIRLGMYVLYRDDYSVDGNQ